MKNVYTDFSAIFVKHYVSNHLLRVLIISIVTVFLNYFYYQWLLYSFGWGLLIKLSLDLWFTWFPSVLSPV